MQTNNKDSKVLKLSPKQKEVMNTAIKMHLENVTPENLESWREKIACSSFASSTGKNGHIDLGVTGRGFYYVRTNLHSSPIRYLYDTAEEAIAKYIELVSD